MSGSDTPNAVEESRWIEAVQWHARRCESAPLSAERERAWQTWFADPQNRRIYRSCARLYERAQHLGSVHRRLPVYPGASHRLHTRASARLRQWAMGGFALSAVIVAAWALHLRPGGMDSTLSRVAARSGLGGRWRYRTAPGQTRRVVLRDGSRLILGADTALTVRWTPARREVDLRHGEVWFHVRHRPHWPFVVAAGLGTITDLDTAFVVDQDSGRTEVTVTEGMVQVALSHGVIPSHPRTAPTNAIRLKRGERLSYGRDVRRLLRRVSPHVALSWTTGQLAFADEPLRFVVEDVSRYSRQPIQVSPAAGRLHLTTLVSSHHIAAWLDGLSRVLPVTVMRSHAGVCIRLRTRSNTKTTNACSPR